MNPPDAFVSALFLLLSFVTAGFVQSFWFRSSFANRFGQPIDGGRTYRGKRIFGDNKTWKGFVAMVPAVGLAFVIYRAFFAILPGNLLAELWPLSIFQYGLLGCLVGFGFMIGELPNSFLKRQIDILPGEAPRNPRARSLCFIVDRFDSITGGMLTLSLLVSVPLATWCCIILVGPVVHFGFSLLLFQLGVKARPA